jgi:ATP-dependent protease ClpP protease subunit
MEKYLLINDIEEKEARSIFEWIDSLQEGTATIDIISHGGQAFVGTGIAQRIIEAQSKGIKFIARVYGICASAAADIALACDSIYMSEGSQIMIHSAWNPFISPDDEGIVRANESQLALIHRKLPDYTMEDLKTDKWFNAEQAVEAGLCVGIIKQDDVKATLKKVAAKYNINGGIDMAITKKAQAEVEAVKAEAPCMNNEEEKKNEETKAIDDDIMTIDVMERIVQRLDEIEKRLEVLEGEGKKADDEGASDGAENGDQIAARLNQLYAKLTEKPVVANVSGNNASASKKTKMEASFERSKKIDLKSFV